MDSSAHAYGTFGEPEFQYSKGLTTEESDRQFQKYGPNVLPEKIVPLWYIFLSLLFQPMPIMIWIASLVEATLENFTDMSILLLIQFANASIAFYEVVKSGDAVAALKASLKPEATVKRDDKWKVINASGLVPGDLVLLGSGSVIPADCRVNHGTIDVDQSQLTGESLPVAMFKGSPVKMGSTVVRGEVEATVEFTGGDTFFGKTASLLQDDAESSNLQLLLIRVIVVILAISVLLCSIVFIYVLQYTTVTDALSFTVVLMVASIPLAIEIVTTTTLAVGSKELTKGGAIVTRLSAIEDLAGMTVLCSDKTGTLTLNKMEIQDETPVYSSAETQYTLLRYAAMATKWNEPARDALDTLVLNAVDLSSMGKELVQQLDFMPFDPTVKRTEGTVRDMRTKRVFKTTKGAPNIIGKLSGDAEILRKMEADVEYFGKRGIRCLGVAKLECEEDTFGNIIPSTKWEILGLLTFLDPPRPDSKETIEKCRSLGAFVKMITGDHLTIALETAKVLSLGTKILGSENLPMLDPVTKAKPSNLMDYSKLILDADGFAHVYPEHKYLIVECLRECGHKVAMTGDGVNDAPALKRADVGIAVQGSTDAARAAADIVLTEEGLSVIVDAILISRCIFERIRNFIIYRISATLQLLCFFFIAVFAFDPVKYEDDDDIEISEFFHMPVLMLMLITLLNDGTLISIGYDNVIPQKVPAVWNLRVVFAISTVLASVACLSSLLMLYAVLASDNISYPQVMTAVYLKISISDFLTLFCARTGPHHFWHSKPSNILLAAGGFALSFSTVMSCVWPDSSPDSISVIGLCYGEHGKGVVYIVYIWIYCLIWFLIQDSAKVAAYAVMKEYNTFGINDTGVQVGNNQQMENLANSILKTLPANNNNASELEITDETTKLLTV